MFDDTLTSSWDERSRRGLTTLTSFGLQALVAGAVLLLSLLRPTALPLFRQLSTPVSMGQPAAEAPAVRAHSGANTSSPSTASIFLKPSPRLPISLPSEDGLPQVGPSGPYIPGAGVRAECSIRWEPPHARLCRRHRLQLRVRSPSRT